MLKNITLPRIYGNISWLINSVACRIDWKYATKIPYMICVCVIVWRYTVCVWVYYDIVSGKVLHFCLARPGFEFDLSCSCISTVWLSVCPWVCMGKFYCLFGGRLTYVSKRRECVICEQLWKYTEHLCWVDGTNVCIREEYFFLYLLYCYIAHVYNACNFELNYI